MRLSLCLIKLSTNSINRTFCWPQQEMQEKWHKQGKQTRTEHGEMCVGGPVNGISNRALIYSIVGVLTDIPKQKTKQRFHLRFGIKTSFNILSFTVYK